MKKFLLFIAVFVLGASFTALAQSQFFTDQDTFGDWFEDSVMNMAYNDVITGYPDGSFQAGNNVTRAELAVMLNRYTDNIVQEKIDDEFQKFLPMFSSLELGSLIISYEDATKVANAGLYELESEPDLTGFVEKSTNLPNDWEVMSEDTEIQDAYLQYYLHYTGERFYPPTWLEVDEWYGPFYF